MTFSEIFCKNKSNVFMIGESCDLKVGSKCNYDCVFGYVKAADVPVSLVCSVNGTWLVPADELCQGLLLFIFCHLFEI